MTVEELLEVLEDQIPENEVVFRTRDGYLLRVDGVHAPNKADRVELHNGGRSDDEDEDCDDDEG